MSDFASHDEHHGHDGHDGHDTGQVMLPPRPLKASKGRGAVSNLQGRYDLKLREQFDDGWNEEDEAADGAADGATATLKTVVTDEIAKSILSRNASPDLPFGVSLNPYRGCEHVM